MPNIDEADDRGSPPGRVPGWVVVAGLVVAGLVAVVSAAVGLLTWVVRDSFAPLLNKLAGWIA